MKNLAYIRQLIFDLKNTLKEVGADSVLQHEPPYYRIDPERIRCDYLSYLETGNPKFKGEYMKQYREAHKEELRAYNLEYQKKYRQTEKGKQAIKEAQLRYWYKKAVQNGAVAE
mgnify:CR=1 FL=1